MTDSVLAQSSGEILRSNFSRKQAIYAGGLLNYEMEKVMKNVSMADEVGVRQ